VSGVVSVQGLDQAGTANQGFYFFNFWSLIPG